MDLEEGQGTGSARALAVSYILHALGMSPAFNHRASYGGTLDHERTAVVERMLDDAPAIGRRHELPPSFWQIFVRYQEATEEELKRQGGGA